VLEQRIEFEARLRGIRIGYAVPSHEEAEEANKNRTKIAIIDMGRTNDQRAGTPRHVSNPGGLGGRNFRKMRRYLWIITFLIFAPFARADSFAGQYTATSGFINGTFGGPFMFAGNKFTLAGAMELAGPCPTFYAYGQSIQGCDD
jgi:hypothetical protein